MAISRPLQLFVTAQNNPQEPAFIFVTQKCI